jgi:AcrR family transcriptional regulator
MKIASADATTHARAPKQRRSRESYDRVILAAADLLREGGLSALTLAAVSRNAQVSIGSIYCRVDGKDSLVREVQAVMLPEIEREFTLLVNRVRRKQLPLGEMVPLLIREFAHYLHKHAALLAAFMQQGDHDSVVEEVGRRSFQQTLLDFKLLLLEYASEFGHPEPEEAAVMCFTVAYATLGRYLGLHSGVRGHGGAGEGNWRRLVEATGQMCWVYLAHSPTPARATVAATPRRKSRSTGRSGAPPRPR